MIIEPVTKQKPPKQRVQIPTRPMHREKTLVMFHLPGNAEPFTFQDCPIPREGEKVDLDFHALDAHLGLIVTRVWYRIPHNVVHVDLEFPT